MVAMILASQFLSLFWETKSSMGNPLHIVLDAKPFFTPNMGAGIRPKVRPGSISGLLLGI